LGQNVLAGKGTYAEVAIGRPWIVRQVKHQGRVVFLGGIAAEEGRACSSVAVDKGLDVRDLGEEQLAAGLLGGEIGVV
jgi:hypothetical protein